jgi:hypothetical protein
MGGDCPAEHRSVFVSELEAGRLHHQPRDFQPRQPRLQASHIFRSLGAEIPARLADRVVTRDQFRAALDQVI